MDNLLTFPLSARPFGRLRASGEGVETEERKTAKKSGVKLPPSRIAVIGAGHWGRNHVRNFAALGALGAICDASDQALAWAREAYPGISTHCSLADILTDQSIKAIVIATPASEHFHGARDALLAGRHVLVEKPMTLEVGEAEELDRLAGERSLILMVGHLLEYHPAFLRLRELVAAGELGDIIRIDSCRLGPGAFHHEEGVLWDLAPHDLSMILRLMGRMPASVLAVGSSHMRTGVQDVAMAFLAFEREADAQVHLSWLCPFKERHLVVVGTRATAVFDDVRREEKLRLYPGVPGDSREPKAVSYPEGEPLRAECEHFLHCIATGQQPLTNGASGIQVTRVAAACGSSLKAGGVRVALS